MSGISTSVPGPPSPAARPFASRRQGIRSVGAIKLLPLLFFFTYLNVTVLIFAFGPWPWPVRDPLKLYGFLALAHLALAAGYLGAIRRPARLSTVRWSPGKLLWVSIVLNLLLLSPTLKYRTSGQVEILAAITDPGRAYFRALSAPTNSYEIRYVEYVRIVSGPVLGLLLPLSVVYWRRLGWWTRLSALVAIAGDLSLWLATGRNKGLADLVIVLPWLLLIGQRSHSRAFPLKRVVRMIALLLVGGLLFAAMFTWFVSSRYTTKTIIPYDDSAQIEARPPLTRPDLQFANDMIVGLTMYVSQGYYALSLGLDEPFVPTWGIGNSRFLMSLAEKLTGNETLHDKTYPARIEKYGWDALGKFHTFYLWIASDLSFPGTIVVAYLLGRLLAVCWVSALVGTNPLAAVLLVNVLIIFYYIPANNQIMQFPEHTTAFWVSLGVWWMTTRRTSAPGRFRAISGRSALVPGVTGRNTARDAGTA
jgi:hypothetical protein